MYSNEDGSSHTRTEQIAEAAAVHRTEDEEEGGPREEHVDQIVRHDGERERPAREPEPLRRVVHELRERRDLQQRI